MKDTRIVIVHNKSLDGILNVLPVGVAVASQRSSGDWCALQLSDDRPIAEMGAEMTIDEPPTFVTEDPEQVNTVYRLMWIQAEIGRLAEQIASGRVFGDAAAVSNTVCCGILPD